MTSECKDVPAVEFRELVRQRAGEEVGEVQSQVEVSGTSHRRLVDRADSGEITLSLPGLLCDRCDVPNRQPLLCLAMPSSSPGGPCIFIDIEQTPDPSQVLFLFQIPLLKRGTELIKICDKNLKSQWAYLVCTVVAIIQNTRFCLQQ